MSCTRPSPSLFQVDHLLGCCWPDTEKERECVCECVWLCMQYGGVVLPPTCCLFHLWLSSPSCQSAHLDTYHLPLSICNLPYGLPPSFFPTHPCKCCDCRIRLLTLFYFFSKVASVLARHGPNKGLSCRRAGWLARGSLLMGRWGGSGPVLIRSSPEGAPARPLRLSSSASVCSAQCAQALHKVFDLTRGDGRRWSLRQDRRPGSLAPVKRQPT